MMHFEVWWDLSNRLMYWKCNAGCASKRINENFAIFGETMKFDALLCIDHSCHYTTGTF